MYYLQDHLEKLRHFVGVANARSIRLYSNQNGLSQPGVSKAIQSLEIALETTLFIRNNLGVEPTAAGRVLLNWAEVFLQSARETETAIKQQSDIKLSGNFTIGCYQSIAVYFLPLFYKFLRQSQPLIKMNVMTAPSSDLNKSLREGRIDFALSIDPPQTAEVVITPVFEDHYSLFKLMGSEHQDDTAPVFTLPTARVSGGTDLRKFLSNTKVYDRLVGCGDFEVAKAMLIADAGYALLPEHVASELLITRRIERVIAYPKLQHFGKHSICFSCKASRETDESTKWIIVQIENMLNSHTFSRS